MANCWLWDGCKTHDGYGRVFHEGKVWKVHRLAFVLLGGQVLPGKEFHHTCGVRHCYNPAHLQQLTRAEHLATIDRSGNGQHNREKTHCKHGHSLADAHIVSSRSGTGTARVCRTCRVINDTKSNTKKKAKKLCQI